MYLTSLYLKNFRCFEQLNLNLNSPVILIEGNNGSGKTSILEALHYLGYLKSFRTHLPKELMRFGSDNFFIKATFESNEKLEIQIGFSNKKRLVKVNQKSISSFKELTDFYKVVTLTEDDLSLVKEGPENRRIFIDRTILFIKPHFIQIFKKYKQILDNRNKLLYKQNIDYELYLILTKQLWEQSCLIREARKEVIELLKNEINAILNTNFKSNNFQINISYEPKEGDYLSLDDLLKTNLFYNEKEQKRTLFGSHLDDFIFIFQNKKARVFASRGQQKLLVALIKIAQLKQLSQTIPFLLDDFVTDFDSVNLEIIIQIIISLKNQLIFTSPATQGNLKKIFLKNNIPVLNISI